MVHCTLPIDATSHALYHQTVEEVWYFLQGKGQVWRKKGAQEEITDVAPGICLAIEPGTHFQFRNLGNQELTFIIVTMPPWPGEHEAVHVQGHWEIV
jgi:mannose-6-phosphate isomerase-like protein (cupin superfamily)